MYTISHAAKKFKMSRSALIHYDRIGLLSPSGRSDGGYRLYSDDDIARLESICRYRDAGLPLESIRKILDSAKGSVSSALEKRFAELNDEIAVLREQQRVISEILTSDGLSRVKKIPDINVWKTVFAKAGIDQETMMQWHQRFEALSPDAHQSFLEMLGIPVKDIKRIRTQVNAGK